MVSIHDLVSRVNEWNLCHVVEVSSRCLSNCDEYTQLSLSSQLMESLLCVQFYDENLVLEFLICIQRGCFDAVTSIMFAIPMWVH